MKRLLVIACCLTSGCYHNTTGLPAGQPAIIVKRQWGPGFLFGTIHPMPVAKACTSGISKHSGFMNFPQWVVAIVTYGIWTPMQQTVTCAKATTAAIATASSDSLWLGSVANKLYFRESCPMAKTLPSKDRIVSPDTATFAKLSFKRLDAPDC